MRKDITLYFFFIVALVTVAGHASSQDQTWKCTYQGSYTSSGDPKKHDFAWSATWVGSGVSWGLSGETPYARVKGYCTDTSCKITETPNQGSQKYYWSVDYREETGSGKGNIKSILSGSYGPSELDRKSGGLIGASGTCVLTAFSEVATDDNTAVQGFLSKLKNTAERHDWKTFISLCDSAHYESQTNLGMGNPQYIAETLGLHFANNNLASNGGIITKDHLDLIKVINFDSKPSKRDGNFVSFTGNALLTDGRILKVQVLLIERQDASGQSTFSLSGSAR